MNEQIDYLTGFGNHFSSEAIKGSLPLHQNSPQKTPLGLYTEQLSGSAFTATRANNMRTWLYRLAPSVLHDEFKEYSIKDFCIDIFKNYPTPPTQMRWNPLPIPSKKVDFLHGLATMASNGCEAVQHGGAVHHYAITDSMTNSYFYNADGQLLIVPEKGSLLLKTELGKIRIEPSEIAVIPRGMKFQVILEKESARGYVCENFGAPFKLPELGPIGANGLANSRDFQTPVASFEEKDGEFLLFCKFQGKLWKTTMNHSPLNVVAWHGNYVPYKYNCKHFNTINTVNFDHPDPSIFTVLTSQSDTLGVANIDFVIFPTRWMVAEHTFRPPYYHRNIMSEYMGLIFGSYDAKEEGFVAGGASLHNCMSAHGPDREAYEKAINAELKPEYYENTLSIMFESRYVWHPSAFALKTKLRQKDYLKCWQDLKKVNLPAN